MNKANQLTIKGAIVRNKITGKREAKKTDFKFYAWRVQAKTEARQNTTGSQIFSRYKIFIRPQDLPTNKQFEGLREDSKLLYNGQEYQIINFYPVINQRTQLVAHYELWI